MTTINIVLMCVLCVMIGFAIGNVWGKEMMKKTFSDLMSNLTEGLKNAASAQTQADKKKEE